MITNEQFNDNLLQFKEILESHLQSPRPLRILQSEIECHRNDKVLLLRLGYNSMILKLVFSFDKFYQVPVLNFQVFTSKLVDGFEEMGQAFDMDNLDLIDNTRQTIPLSVENHLSIPGTFLFVHPCETTATVETFIRDSGVLKPTDSSSTAAIKYLVTWNAVYGTGIFSQLYLKYRT